MRDEKDLGKRASAKGAEDARETLAGIPVVSDPSVPRGTWQLRDGFGSVLWEFHERIGVARTDCATRRGMPSALSKPEEPS